MLPSENHPKTSAHVRSPNVDPRIKTRDDHESQDGTSSRGGLSDENHFPKEETGADKEVVLDVTLEEQLGAEKVCRICHLSSETSSGRSELIPLGCHCKEELGISHRDCAETWFKQRGNRLCEICNKTAKNVRFIEDTRILIMEINEDRPITTTSFEPPREGSPLCKQTCNFFLACLILTFVISSFLRVKIF